jgi:hypothetical protein
VIIITRSLLLAAILGSIIFAQPAHAAVHPEKRSECAASVADLKAKIATLDGDQAKILEALEAAIKKDMSCAQWLAAATVEATSADPKLIGEISFVAFSTADETMKSAIAGAIRGAANGGATNGAGARYGKSPVSFGKNPAGHLLGPDEASRLDGSGVTLVDASDLPNSIWDSLSDGAYAKLGDALFASHLLGGLTPGDAALIGAAGRIFGPGGVSPTAPEVPPGFNPDPDPGPGPGPPNPPVSDPNMAPDNGDDEGGQFEDIETF